jgi:hypothetical protein
MCGTCTKLRQFRMESASARHCAIGACRRKSADTCVPSVRICPNFRQRLSRPLVPIWEKDFFWNRRGGGGPSLEGVALVGNYWRTGRPREFPLWTHGSASVLGRMNCKQTCRQLCGAASYGSMFARRRGLVIAPGLLHVGGHGQARPLSPNSDTTEIQRGNRAVRHLNISGRREPGLQGRVSPTGALAGVAVALQPPTLQLICNQ